MKFRVYGVVGLLCLGLIFTGCSNNSVDNANETNDVQTVEETVIDENESVVEEENTEEVSYKLNKKEIQEGEVSVSYPEMSDYVGELTMEYINESFMEFAKQYLDKANYSGAKIDYTVKRMDNEIISIVFEGTIDSTAVGSRSVKKSLNIDLATSNTIDYNNFVKDDEAVRKILAEKLAENFEAEGLFVYFADDSAVFYYYVLDDSSDETIEISVPLVELEGLINTDFGEHPAS